MATYDFVSSDAIEVYFNGVLLSTHLSEEDALETVMNHSTVTKKTGLYLIRPKGTQVLYTAPIVQRGVISADVAI